MPDEIEIDDEAADRACDDDEGEPPSDDEVAEMERRQAEFNRLFSAPQDTGPVP